MPILVAKHLQKSFGNRVVLDDASIAIDERERVGVVGLNGSGKTTLARILAGQEVPDQGEVAFSRGAVVRWLPQMVDLPPGRTALDVATDGLAAWREAKSRYDKCAEAIAAEQGDLEEQLEAQGAALADIERYGGWDQTHQVESMLQRVGLTDLHRDVAQLSGGDRRRVALARALVSRPQLLILDEPSNHIDVETIEWLEQFLVHEFDGAVIVITHDRLLLDRVAQRVVEIDRGALYSYDGNYETYLQAKAERLELAERTEANRKRFLRRELEWLRRQPKARGGKQKARIQRAEQQINAPKLEKDKAAQLSLASTRVGKTILDLRDVSIAVGTRLLVEHVTLTMRKGERVGIIGRNGIGKTSLLRCVLDELKPAAGQVVVGKNTEMLYFDQHRSDLVEADSIYENVAGNKSHVQVAGVPVEAHGYLERFQFDRFQQRQPVASLSGGERARAALAKLLCQEGNLLLLDEPTNDLDVTTLSALEQMLIDFDGCELIVTHDRWFLNRVATSILAFEGDGRVTLYAGNYDSYRAQASFAAQIAQQRDRQPSALVSDDAKAKRPVRRSAAPKLTFAQRKELDGMMQRIEAAEQQIETLEQQLADPKLYSERGDKVAEITQRLQESNAQLEELMARWEHLESIAEASGQKKS